MHKDEDDREVSDWVRSARATSRDRAFERRQQQQRQAAATAEKLREEQIRRAQNIHDAADRREAEVRQKRDAEKAARVAARENVMRKAQEQVDRLNKERARMQDEAHRESRRQQEEEAWRRDKKQRDADRKRRHQAERDRAAREEARREEKEAQIRHEAKEREEARRPLDFIRYEDMEFVERCQTVFGLQEDVLRRQQRGQLGVRRLQCQMLGVQSDAGDAAVERQWRRTIMLFHPDKVASEYRELAVAASQCINSAKVALFCN